MARTIEIAGPPAETSATIDLFPIGSDTSTQSVAATEATNRSGVYTGTITAGALDYYVQLQGSDGLMLADGWARVSATDTTHHVVDDLNYQLADLVSYCLTVLAGTISTANTATETFDLTLEGEAYRAAVSVDSDGNRTAQTLSKP